MLMSGGVGPQSFDDIICIQALALPSGSAMFRTHGLTPTLVSETPTSMLATLALVAAGVGVSLVPAAIARNLAITGAEFRPLAAAAGTPTWPVALAHMPLSATSPSARLLALWRKEACL